MTTVLIIGASGGIGLETLKSALKTGYKVRALARHLRLVAKLAMGYRGYGLRPDQVVTIGRHLGVGEQDVIDMNRRLSGDVSLDAPDSGRRGCGRVAGLAG